jgi:hypothetical protein
VKAHGFGKRFQEIEDLFVVSNVRRERNRGRFGVGRSRRRRWWGAVKPGLQVCMRNGSGKQKQHKSESFHFALGVELSGARINCSPT